LQSKAIYWIGNRKAEIREIEVSEPKYNEVQAKTIMNGICMGDVWRFTAKDNTEPELVGHEGMGIVTEVGEGVKHLKKGDYITTQSWSQYSNQLADDAVLLSCTAEDYADFLIEPVSCAVNAAAYLNIYPGDRAIQFGSGYMGLLLAQLLCKSPLSEYIVIDMKESNLALAARFGATETVHIGTEKGQKRMRELEQEQFDIVYEASGAKDALEKATRMTRSGGKLGIYAWHHHPRLIDTSEWHMKGLQVLNVTPFITLDDKPNRSFAAADRLIKAGIVSQRELITHTYSFEDVARAMEETVQREEGFIKSILTFT
jgi:threonine dehydrogenase-like Zn-dependent dehydrogenase